MSYCSLSRFHTLDSLKLLSTLMSWNRKNSRRLQQNCEKKKLLRLLYWWGMTISVNLTFYFRQIPTAQIFLPWNWYMSNVQHSAFNAFLVRLPYAYFLLFTSFSVVKLILPRSTPTACLHKLFFVSWCFPEK